MALDPTRENLSSLLGIVYQTEAALDQGDLQTLRGVYRGILVGELVLAVGRVLATIRAKMAGADVTTAMASASVTARQGGATVTVRG